MRGKLLFGAATAALLVLGFAAPSSAQDADPPGDVSTTATLNSGGSVTGAFEQAGDTDWYRLNVERGQRYSLALAGLPNADGAAVDPVLIVYDEQGNQLAFNDDANESLNAALIFTPQASGVVFVEARAFDPEALGAYTLGVEASVVPPDDAGNDNTTRARVTVGRAVNGQLEYEGDVDWYRFSARTGQRYSVTLRGADENGVGDPFLRILDREGAEIAVNDDDGESLNSAAQFSVRANGDIFIEARAFADAYSGGYTLEVAAERLPSDSISADTRTRGSLTIGQNRDGAIDFAEDNDWYRVRLTEGQSYRFTLNSAGDSPLGDPLLRIYSSSGEELAIDDDGGEGLNSYLEFTAPSTGAYFVSAGGFNPEATGGYTLAARAGDVPGDATTDASVSADGDYREGVLSPAGDRDWFAVNLAEGQAMRVGLITAEGNGEPLGDPYLVLYGPDGTEILRDDDGGDGLNSFFEFQAPSAGRYFIEARGFTDDAQGRYALNIMGGEIGNSYDSADYLMPNSEGRISMINAADDADWFAIEMVEGRPYRINVEGFGEDALGDPVLTLYDAQGNEVASDDDGGAGLNAYLSFTSTTGGPYFAAVSAYGGGTGRYYIRVTDTDVPGNVATDENLDAAAGDSRLSRTDFPGDIDFYRVVLEEGARYTITVSGAGENPLADPFLAISDGENNVVASDDDSGPGLDARLRFTPAQTGEFYIQASGLGGSTGWYQVEIVRQ